MKLTDKLKEKEEKESPPEELYHFTPLRGNSTTCCGLGEAYNFCVASYIKPTTIKEIRKDFLNLLVDAKKGALFATVVQIPEYEPEKVEHILKLCGWESGITFKNPNTGRPITIWMLDKAKLINTMQSDTSKKKAA